MGKTGTILVVDDEAYILELARDMLTLLGHDVRTCPDGNQAIDLYRDRYSDIDVVILDMSMPKISGTEVFKAMKAINPEIKAIISSGHGLEEHFANAFDAGACGLVRKPYTIETMSGEISRLLEIGAIHQP